MRGLPAKTHTFGIYFGVGVNCYIHFRANIYILWKIGDSETHFRFRINIFIYYIIWIYAFPYANYYYYSLWCCRCWCFLLDNWCGITENTHTHRENWAKIICYGNGQSVPVKVLIIKWISVLYMVCHSNNNDDSWICASSRERDISDLLLRDDGGGGDIKQWRRLASAYIIFGFLYFILNK